MGRPAAPFTPQLPSALPYVVRTLNVSRHCQVSSEDGIIPIGHMARIDLDNDLGFYFECDGNPLDGLSRGVLKSNLHFKENTGCWAAGTEWFRKEMRTGPAAWVSTDLA